MTNSKKSGLGLLALAIVAGIYYFSAGSEKLATAMKTQVNAEFASLKTEGFTVETKEVSKNEEHFELSFDEPEKIAAFITSKGATITAEDAQVLKGLKLGVDVHYLADAYSAVSLDLYPLTLPSVLTENIEDPEEKKLLAQVQDMLTKKVFLAHVDVNKLGTGFKGYVKDIDETLQAKETLNLVMKDFTFKGSLEDEKLTRISQVLKTISFSVANDMLITLENITSDYEVSGPSDYDYSSTYKIEAVKAVIPGEFDFHLKDLEVDSASKVEKSLAKVNLSTHIKAMQFKDKTQDTSLESLTFNMDFDNLPVAAIEKLEKLAPNDEKAIQTTLQELISQGLKLTISDFSVQTLKMKGQSIKGFNFNAAMALDKSLDFSAIQQNPMSALSAIDADLKLSLSDDLFALAAQQPQAVMVMMMIQPKDVNGDKVYKVELKDGKVSVNGQPMM